MFLFHSLWQISFSYKHFLQYFKLHVLLSLIHLREYATLNLCIALELLAVREDWLFYFINQSNKTHYAQETNAASKSVTHS